MTSIKKFLEFARCAGKTFSIKQQVLKDKADGKRVAIVARWTPVYDDIGTKARTPSANKPAGCVHLYSLGTVVNALQRVSETNNSIWWKHLAGFEGYDHLYVDADCYEHIIFMLLTEREKLREKLSNLAFSLGDVEREL